jgi:hypothetical protein
MGNYQEYCGGNCMNAESNIKFGENSNTQRQGVTERNKTLITLNDYQEFLLLRTLKIWRRYHEEKNSLYSTNLLTEKLKKLDEFILERKGKFVDLKTFENCLPNDIVILLKKLAEKENKKGIGFKSFENKRNLISGLKKERENTNLLILRKPVLLQKRDLYLGYWNLNGETEGYGKLIKNIDETSTILIEGYFQPGGLCEYGRYYFQNGTYFEGNLENNLPNLSGELKIFDEIIYSGEWIDGEFNGKGLLYLSKNNEFKYEGNFENNLFSGFGKLSYDNPKEYSYFYEGNFKKSKFEGKGNFILIKNENNNDNDYDNDNDNYQKNNNILSKEEYKGLWKNGLPNGNGKYIWKNGNIYEGNYEDGKKKGFGKLTFNSGISFFEGMWSNGKPNGKGNLLLEKDFKISGVWRQGKIQKIDNIEEFEKLFNDQNLLNVPIDNEIFSNDFIILLKKISPNEEKAKDIFFDENNENGKIISSNFMKLLAKGIEKNIRDLGKLKLNLNHNFDNEPIRNNNNNKEEIKSNGLI